MDSKTINKLIRSEVWPILREQGFSRFESRSALAYIGPFINVVNFQSFNSHLAARLGCTTYSFALNLGTYVIGSPGREWVKCDDADLLLPYEYQCQFRTQLEKRTPVDGFSRNDIFFVHPDGRTTGPCFDEVRHLLSKAAPQWFRAYNDLTSLISRMNYADESGSSKSVSTMANTGSYSWNELKSILSLLRHREAPTQHSADVALDNLNQTIGSILDFSMIQSGRPGEERYATNIRELWDQFGDFRPAPAGGDTAVNASGSLDGPIWVSARRQPDRSVGFLNPPVVLSARAQFWPKLKSSGFSEFTDRLAHRISKDIVEVVEVLPVDPFERKTAKFPAGLFRIGVGIFWPALGWDGFLRTNRSGEPRPTVNECHVSNWLAPEAPAWKGAGTAFGSIEDGFEAIAGAGLAWLGLFRGLIWACRCSNGRTGSYSGVIR
jgi:hypothetical protein